MFLEVRPIDILDIILVAILLFQLYKLIKGTVALKIFFGVFSFIIFWVLVNALEMELLGSILDNVVSVGVIALIVLFQEEIRKFLLIVGSRYKFEKWFSLEKVMAKNDTGMLNIYVNPVVNACKKMAKTKTGALIIITNQSELVDIAKTGELLNANISVSLIESIFFKNNPLHDGAVVINRNKIKAARCILPISHHMELPKELGLRHRAGVGISQTTDAKVIIVSEETGMMAYAHKGKLTRGVSEEDMKEFLMSSSS